MVENKEKKKTIQKNRKGILFLILIQLLFSTYFLYLFYTEYKNNNIVFQNYDEVKISKTIQKFNEVKNNILLSINNKEYLNIKDKPFLTLYYDNTSILKDIRKNFIKQKIKKEETKKEETIKMKEYQDKDIRLNIPSLKLKGIRIFSLVTGDLKEINKRLTKGVIKYSGQWYKKYGAISIFGHSSQPLRDYKEFYSYFRKIPSLTIGDEISIVIDKNSIKYSVIEGEEVELDNLKTVLDKYDKKGLEEESKYIIFITCYPINTTQKRWVTVFKKI